jgi:hypothetical protein
MIKILAYNFKAECSRKKDARKVCMVQMNRAEALQTIKSLSEQLITGSPNSDRYEQYDVNGIDFSIAVSDKFGTPEYEESCKRLNKIFSKKGKSNGKSKVRGK